MKDTHDVIVIGSGIGGGATARRLAENGVKVLLIERGEWVPREEDNWGVAPVFFDKKYVAKETWLDANGSQFRPSIFYNVGGCTKFYGAAMIRFRERDFEHLEHREGSSPAWPVRYSDLEPYYGEAEHLFGVHGNDDGDPSAPWRSEPYPFPPLESEPIVARSGRALTAQGARTSALPLAVNYSATGTCIDVRPATDSPASSAQRTKRRRRWCGQLSRPAM